MTVRGRRRLLALVAALAFLAGAVTAQVGDDDAPRRPSALVPAAGDADPFAYDPDRREEFEARAAAGLAHVIYAKSPGGVVASAARTARYRRLVEEAAADAGLDADTIEAMILLESAGRPDARASDDVEGAVGLTQILAETGRSLLGMRIDTAASRRLTRAIARAEERGQRARAERLRARRRRVDERYDPAKAVRATARYLTFAREQLGRDDLAVAAYHMGVGNLQRVLRAFGADGPIPYAELFFDASPLRHARAWEILASLGDDSATYLWRVLAAKDIMRRYRADQRALAERARAMTSRPSAEAVLHPDGTAERFDDPEAVEAALADGTLTPLRARELEAAGIRLDPAMGALADGLGTEPDTYRALRPEALAALVHLARGTRAIAGTAPLVVTRAVEDARLQALAAERGQAPWHDPARHATGWSFDIARRYRTRRQAAALQFMLDRLQALNLIAWEREPAAIHVTAGPDARRLLELLEPARG
jgi:soluble lytic murein transglycosylase-like protein